jgi:hypothetical protein
MGLKGVILAQGGNVNLIVPIFLYYIIMFKDGIWGGVIWSEGVWNWTEMGSVLG